MLTALVLAAAAVVVATLALAGVWRGDHEATAGHAPDARGDGLGGGAALLGVGV